MSRVCRQQVDDRRQLSLLRLKALPLEAYEAHLLQHLLLYHDLCLTRGLIR